MKIVYVITKANWGGAQRYVYDLAIAAKEAGHAVHVAYGEPGLLALKLREKNIPTTHIDGLARDVGFFRELLAFSRLRQFLSKERPAIVHINSSKAGALGTLAARFAGVPRIIFTAHGWAFNETRPAWQRIVLFLASGIIVLLSHETICVSEAVRRDIRHFPFIQKKHTVIHLGIQCVESLPRAAARAALTSPTIGKYWIGMISELHPTKRIQDAIEALHLLSEKHPDILLVVIGEGSERAELQARIRTLGLHERVHLAGFKKDARELLSAFDLFLHTSQSEALGYAVLEAGCASVPVVATRVGGIPEIIPDAQYGLLIPAHAPTKIAAAIETLIEHPDHANALAEHLHTRIVDAFSIEEMCTKTFACYGR